MKKMILLCFVSTCVLNSAYTQNPLIKQWDKRFGGTNSDALYCFQQTSDGGYLLGGDSDSDSSGDKTQMSLGYDYWIIKIDSLGAKQWDKDFGGASYDYFGCLQQTTDGGYIIGGFSNSDSSGDKTQNSWGGQDYWILKIDSLGNKQWDKDFGGNYVEQLYSVQQTADGGYILGGTSDSDSSGDKTQPTWGSYDFWIVKVDSLGNKQWDKSYGGDDTDILYSLQQTGDGGYILGGASYSDVSGNKTQPTWGGQDYWIIKIDSIGNKEWDKDLGGTDDDRLYSLKQTNDGGYILGGVSVSGISGDKTQNTVGGYDYWIIKTDPFGSKLWDKDFGGNDNEFLFGTISQTSDSGYLIAGNSRSNISGDKTENNLGMMQSWIVKTDSSGIKVWDKTLLTTGTDSQGYASETKDGCYAITNRTDAGAGGDKTQPSWGSSDYWIIKFCDTTLTTSIMHLENSPLYFSIYPNPSKDILYISTKNNFKPNEISLYDAAGRMVLQKEISGAASFSIKELHAGIYFYEIKDAKGNAGRGKVVRE